MKMAKFVKTFDMARLFSALADRTRLRLMNLMDDREVCVCYFVEVLQQPQPKISRHLAYLRKAGLVSARREGKWMHYRMERPAEATAVLDAVRKGFTEDAEMQNDLKNLGKACCEPEQFVALAGAPAPVKARNVVRR